jgi:hypothetical protein
MGRSFTSTVAWLMHVGYYSGHRTVLLEQVSEQDAVVHHGLPQLLGVDVVASVGGGQSSGCPIVLDDLGVLDGKVGDALFETVRGVTARPHDLLDELIGTRHRRRWIIDELRLKADPCRFEARAVCVAQLVESKMLDATRSRSELTFRATSASELLDGPLVLGAKTAS